VLTSPRISLVKKRHWFWFYVIIWFALIRAGYILYTHLVL